MHPQRVWVSVAAGLGLISALLPWARLGMLSVSGVNGSDGVLVIGLFAVALVAALGHPRSSPLAGGSRATVMLVGVLGAALGGWKIVQLGEAGRGMIRATPGIGLYLMIGAGLAMFMLGFTAAGGTKSEPPAPRDAPQPPSNSKPAP